MTDAFPMQSDSKIRSEIRLSQSSDQHGEKSINRDDQDMARLGKRQELRVGDFHTSMRAVDAGG